MPYLAEMEEGIREKPNLAKQGVKNWRNRRKVYSQRSDCMSSALDLGTIVIMFGWIPFWWAVALFSLYRMNENDERNEHDSEVDPA